MNFLNQETKSYLFSGQISIFIIEINDDVDVSFETRGSSFGHGRRGRHVHHVHGRGKKSVLKTESDLNKA